MFLCLARISSPKTVSVRWSNSPMCCCCASEDKGGSMVLTDSLIVVGLLAAYALFMFGVGGR
jgi:hypothetical protein